MKLEIEKWAIEKIKEAVIDILELWQFDEIELTNKEGNKMGMSKQVFLDKLEDKLK